MAPGWFYFIAIKSAIYVCVCARMRALTHVPLEMLPRHRCMHLCVENCPCWYIEVPLIWHPWAHTWAGLLDVPDY